MNDLTALDEVILVVTSVSSTGGSTYSFLPGKLLELPLILHCLGQLSQWFLL